MKKHRQLAGMLCAGILALGMVATAEAALKGRLPVTPGGSDFQAYFDDDLGVTWLKSTTLAWRNTFGVAGIAADGTMTWDTANIWIDAMNADGANGYLGFNDWRLPVTAQCGNNGVCGINEMLHLNTTENVYWDDPLPLENPFVDLHWIEYWSSELAPGAASAWAFGFDLSGQTIINKDWAQYAWAVRSGDVGAVPVPAAVWLFGSGLLGLLGFAKRKG